MSDTAVVRHLEVTHLHQPSGWLSPGFVELDADGTIAAVSGTRPAAWVDAAVEQVDGYVVPGAVNVHSHAHQRGLAGHAEGGRGASEAENFWSWRSRMYAFVLRLAPDDFEAIAAYLYLEMLRAGFTTVGEFHYLHQDPDGQPYANPFEMSARLLAAAQASGIALTMLPSLYTHAGIGQPAAPEQRRFAHHSLDAYLQLVERLRAAAQGAEHPLLRVGIAPHSLRAVSAEELAQVVAAVAGTDLPIHLHVAEQTREVEETRQHLGASSARWLLEHAPLDARWTFIHATHCTPDELRELAQRGVTVGLCPTTEGNLGDGLFGLREFHAGGGRWGIGTDANLLPDPMLELRTLEYTQRLLTQRRSILVSAGDATTEQPGRRLYDLAARAGAQSLAQPVGALVPGRRADLVLLDSEHPTLIGQSPETVLDAWLVAGSPALVRSVMVGGRWVVRERQHAQQEAITARYRQTMRTLLARD